MHGRHAEDAEHLATNELLDRAAVTLEHGGHVLEEARGHEPQRLGVESVGDDVAQKDGDGLARLNRGVHGERSAASAAVRGITFVRLAARCASRLMCRCGPDGDHVE